ncbi:hypothetical protein V8E51_003056 [Hyaloscypha variabilis]
MNFDAQPQPVDVSESNVTQTSIILQIISDPESPALDYINISSSDMISNPIKQVKPFPWGRCPVEVRDMIFDEVDNAYRTYFVWKGRMSPLVIVLRGLKRSYKQALRRFMGENGPYLDMLTMSMGFNIQDMNFPELDTFKEATICLCDPIDHLDSRKSLDFVGDGLQKPEWFTSQFLRAQNIRTVYLCRNEERARSPKNAARFISEFPFWLGGFTRLSDVMVSIPILHGWIEGDRHRRIVNAIMNRILEKVGV